MSKTETLGKCEVCNAETKVIMFGYDSKDNYKMKKMCLKCFVKNDLGPALFGG